MDATGLDSDATGVEEDATAPSTDTTPEDAAVEGEDTTHTMPDVAEPIDAVEISWAVTSYECSREGGGGGGGGGGPLPEEARNDIDFLFENAALVTRHVEWITGGVETLTTSDDPEVAAALQRHVAAMEARLSGGGGVRMWDPIFVTVADNYDIMSLEYDAVEGGVHVVNTGEGELGATLARAHAEVVSRFVAGGQDEAPMCHDLVTE